MGLCADSLSACLGTLGAKDRHATQRKSQVCDCLAHFGTCRKVLPDLLARRFEAGFETPQRLAQRSAASVLRPHWAGRAWKHLL